MYEAVNLKCLLLVAVKGERVSHYLGTRFIYYTQCSKSQLRLGDGDTHSGWREGEGRGENQRGGRRRLGMRKILGKREIYLRKRCCGRM